METRYSRPFRNARSGSQEPKRHIHAVGTDVTLLGSVIDPRVKAQKTDPKTARFEITRLLPAEGRALQYRIKNLTTGLEFVVVEEQIAAGT